MTHDPSQTGDPNNHRPDDDGASGQVMRKDGSAQRATGERIVPMRLQKFLSRSGVASRRRSEDLMTARRVTVNGEIVTELGSKVDPLVDVVCVDGNEVRLSDSFTYLLLNKPEGYITTMSDPQGRPTVAELVPVKEHPGLFPVGRLDFDTTGLLLFMTDGEMAHRLLHPSYKVEKVYLAEVEGRPTSAQLEELRKGVTLEDGPTAPARIECLEERDRSSVILCAITEGRKRQVRRMFKHVGHPVVALDRTDFGEIPIRDVPRGSWRLLDKNEIAYLQRVTKLDVC